MAIDGLRTRHPSVPRGVDIVNVEWSVAFFFSGSGLQARKLRLFFGIWSAYASDAMLHKTMFNCWKDIYVAVSRCENIIEVPAGFRWEDQQTEVNKIIGGGDEGREIGTSIFLQKVIESWCAAACKLQKRLL